MATASGAGGFVGRCLYQTVECDAMWNVIGHHRAIAELETAMKAARLPHALLFTGPDGTGKTTLALELAKALNCTGEDPPCQSCVQCRQITGATHPDVTLVERPDGKDSIVIQQVRELREAAALRPFQGRQKVYIVAGAGALTAQAADALLKTLEEPQPQVTIILTATEAEALPATVVSRCRLMTLRGVEKEAIAAALTDRGVSSGAADNLARLARGSVGWALQALKQPKLVAQRENLVTRASQVLDVGLDERLQLAEELVADRKDRSTVRRNVEVLVLLAQDMVLAREGLPPRLVSAAQEPALTVSARRYSLSQLGCYLKSLGTAMERIDQNVDPRLALEAVMVGLP